MDAISLRSLLLNGLISSQDPTLALVNNLRLEVTVMHKRRPVLGIEANSCIQLPLLGINIIYIILQ